MHLKIPKSKNSKNQNFNKFIIFNVFGVNILGNSPECMFLRQSKLTSNIAWF